VAPVDEEEIQAWLALALCAEGRPDQWLAFARALGGVSATVTAGETELAAAGASARAIARLREAWPHGARKTLEAARRLGLGLACFEGPDFPETLRSIADPPLVLFWKGKAPASCVPALAVVGARRCTAYGQAVAARLGREAAAAGVVVVSGLARGVDAAAHRGALETGRTAAVLAGGLDRIYPGEHRGLAERIVEAGGTLLSEQPPGLRPVPRLFPYRNRIITGLAAATVVVEACQRSGSLASARHALTQGREVFAVPGPIDSPLSEGTNRLLGQGAAPFCAMPDLGGVPGLHVLSLMNAHNKLIQKEYPCVELSREGAALLGASATESATADELSAATGLDGTRVLALLTALELDGLIRREDHGRFRATTAGLAARASPHP
jgi:DNA processing protein